MNFVIPNCNFSLREIMTIPIFKKAIELYNPKTLLNVGHRAHCTGFWISICNANNIDWKIIEIFKPNVDHYIDDPTHKGKISQGDIMDCKWEDVDILLFWAGPEHVEKERFISGLPIIESKVKHLILFSTPFGILEQNESYGNPYEKHVSTWSVEDWKQLGYEVVATFDKPGLGLIIAYKFKS